MTQEKIRVPGRRGEYDSELAGKRMVYYCPYCQSVPTVGEDEMAMGLAHDMCVHMRVPALLEFLTAIDNAIVGNTPKK